MRAKTVLIPKPHSILPGVTICELWYAGQMIGTVAGADGPGVRLLSKFNKTAAAVDGMVTEVRIDPGADPRD